MPSVSSGPSSFSIIGRKPAPLWIIGDGMADARHLLKQRCE